MCYNCHKCKISLVSTLYQQYYMLSRSREPEIQCLSFASLYHILFSFIILYIHQAVYYSRLNGFTFVIWGYLYLNMRFEGRLVNFYVVWFRVESSFKAIITQLLALILLQYNLVVHILNFYNQYRNLLPFLNKLSVGILRCRKLYTFKGDYQQF